MNPNVPIEQAAYEGTYNPVWTCSECEEELSNFTEDDGELKVALPGEGGFCVCKSCALKFIDARLFMSKKRRKQANLAQLTGLTLLGIIGPVVFLLTWAELIGPFLGMLIMVMLPFLAGMLMVAHPGVFAKRE